MVMVDNPNKFADKFKLKSSRLTNWDYSTPGFYFITICTLNHNNFFGKIIDNKMELSKMGIIVNQCLIDISKHFSNVILDEYIVMPNHIHLLLNLLKPLSNFVNNCRDVACNVSTNLNNVSTKSINFSTIKNNFNEGINYFSKISPKSNTISSIIRSFKSAVTKQINPKTIFFAWQPRFHDEIIKDEKELLTIKNYIINNPINWKKDKFYKV